MLIGMVYEPSPKKIEEECEKIRRGWTVHEERNRRVNKRKYSYSTPVISLRDLPEDTQYWINSVNRLNGVDESGDLDASCTEKS